MTAPAATLPASPTGAAHHPARRLPSPRVLGTLGLLGSPGMYVIGQLMEHMAPGAVRDLATWAVSLLYLAAAGCTAVGLRTLRATGDGRAARVLVRVQLALHAVASVHSTVDALRGPAVARTGVWLVADAAWPLSHVLMLVVGVLVVRAGRLRGWRRAPAFAVGLALPIMFALRATAPAALVTALSFPVLTTLGFGLLALAVRSAGATRAR